MERSAGRFSLGSGMSCWRRLHTWQQAGVWDRLHEALLAKLRAADRIDRSVSSFISSSVRAVGSGKNRTQPHRSHATRFKALTPDGSPGYPSLR